MSGVRHALHAAGPWVLAVVALGFAFGLGEVGLRAGLPPERFLDPKGDCFWTLRLRRQMERAGDVSRLFGSGRYDATIGWKPQPNRRSPLENTNSRGLRGVREYDLAKPAGALRLVVHGDSFTWGFGVHDDETYAARLEAALADVEALNLGINGQGIDQQYLYWLDEGRRYHPDLVILGFFVPDFHRVALSVREYPKPRFLLGERGLRLMGCPVPSPQVFLESRTGECGSKSRLVDLLAAVHRKLGGREKEEAFRHKAALTKAILAAWKESTAAVGAEFCVVVIPHKRYRAYPEHERIERVLQESAQANGFRLLNLTEPLQRFEASGEPVYQKDNGHWTAAGHAFAAQQITALLRSIHIVQGP